MSVKILGKACCQRCNELYFRFDEVIKKLGANIALEKIESVDEIIAYGVLGTPGVVIDEKVISEGISYSPAAIEKLLREEGVIH